MKEVPVVDIKITDLKKLYQKGYNMLEELRHEADAPVVKAKIFNKRSYHDLRIISSKSIL